jgi:hypothetical protein
VVGETDNKKGRQKHGDGDDAIDIEKIGSGKREKWKVLHGGLR